MEQENFLGLKLPIKIKCLFKLCNIKKIPLCKSEIINLLGYEGTRKDLRQLLDDLEKEGYLQKKDMVLNKYNRYIINYKKLKNDLEDSCLWETFATYVHKNKLVYDAI
ncbi:MAG: hypothetical protein ACOCV1_01555 [Bacillota bacterium]